jgi:hypothetical protein
MLQNAFVGKPGCPTDTDLAKVLGSARELWDRLIDELVRDFDLDGQEWHSTSLRSGWTLRLQRASRNIVYLTPAHCSFMASFALGDRAMAVARQSGLSASALSVLDQARRYAEGTAVRIEVHTLDDISTVKRLAAAKLAQ